MNRDRLVQLVALLIAVACVIGTTALAPAIRAEREELQLTFEIEADRGTAPSYVLAAAAMGSFRGLAVNVLWYRIERLKEEGRLHEANTLAEWITTLQPRFGQVWSYHAWNLAYNISVQTHTPEERWMWVSRGIDLLRDRGIPNNPTVIRLYRELAWIFFHKVGQRMDDHHWYYKAQLAQEWQELLGAPTEGATTEEAIDRFRPVAEAADAYFRLNRPSRLSMVEINELIEEHPDEAELLGTLRNRHMSLARFLRETRHAQATLESRHRFSLASALEPIAERELERQQRARHDAVTLLRQDDPAAAAMLDAWHDYGLELDDESLRAYGWLGIVQNYISPQAMLEQEPEFLTDKHLAVLRYLYDHRGQSEGLSPFLAFLRAKVLTERYNMQPGYMLELMELFGPLDWRHPASHAVYWASLGVEMSGRLRDSTKYDVLNTDRNVVHGLQSLMFGGRVSYDPWRGDVDLLPDPRFIDAYGAAMEMALERAQSGEVEWMGSGTETSFQHGHENFLHKAVLFSYLYGSREQAQRYLDEARERYGDAPHLQRHDIYAEPLEEFVLNTLRRDMGMIQVVRPFIEAMIQRGLSEGLALNRPDVFRRFHRLAEQMHTMYTERVGGFNVPTAQREFRLDLGSFDELLVSTYVNYMRSPGIDIYTRSRVYRNTPHVLRERAYQDFLPAIEQQAQQFGVNPAAAFPPPGELDDTDIELRRRPADADDTVRRR